MVVVGLIVHRMLRGRPAPAVITAPTAVAEA
jgi:hypothetical protein